jgi:hypothetical protein
MSHIFRPNGTGRTTALQDSGSAIRAREMQVTSPPLCQDRSTVLTILYIILMVVIDLPEVVTDVMR